MISMMGLLLMIAVSACSDDDNVDAGNEGNDAGVENGNADVENDNDSDETNESDDGGMTSMLDEDAEDIDKAGFDEVEMEEPAEQISASMNTHKSMAHEGVFASDGEGAAVFNDYESGERLTFDTTVELQENKEKNGFVAHADYASLYFYDGDYYFAAHGDDNYEIQKLDVDSGTIESIIESGEYAVIAKDDDTLYVADDEVVRAISPEDNDTVWETEGELEANVVDISQTDDSIVIRTDNGFEVYAKDDGEKLSSEEGAYFDVVGNGDVFYALSDATDHHAESDLEVTAYDESGEEQEVLIETPTIEGVYDREFLTLDLKNGRFYIHFENGMFVFDADSHDRLWTASVGDLEDRDNTGDDNNYDFYAAYGDDEVYTMTEKFEDGARGEIFFGILDADTGDVKERYTLGDVRASGPFVDEEEGNVILNTKQYEDIDPDETATAYVLPMK